MVKNKIKILVIFGTRPEAIKMAPIIKELELHKDKFETIVCVTAQHREMLDRVLSIFDIIPQYDLDIMKDNQTLSELTARIMNKVSKVLIAEDPDWVFVQGDTTTTFISALASFYQNIKIVHIEAGLRTDNKYSPFPEEINRRITSHIADLHFAPTKESKENLIREGIKVNSIFITGNTVIDALHLVVRNQKGKNKKWEKYFNTKYGINLSGTQKTILVTGHRRESFGNGFSKICDALTKIAKLDDNLQIVYPVHLNPNVQKPVYSILDNMQNIHLIEPLDYEPFVFLMNKSYIILTDSGGIQEEAPSLGKPVLVMRETTERPEGIKSGITKLVGTDVKKIVDSTKKLISNRSEYNLIAKSDNPYGTGKSSERIIDIFTKNC